MDVQRRYYKKMTVDGVRVHIHRWLAENFIPNPYNLPCVNHKDGDKWNNELNNLEWCTYSENIQHAFDTGLNVSKQGEEHHSAKLTQEQVDTIRQIYVKGCREYGAKPLGRRFGVSYTQIRRIVNNDRWKKCQL